MVLGDSIKTIKGIGDKTAAAMSKLGIYTVSDLLMYYPRTYISYEDPVDIENLQTGMRQSVRVMINSRVEVRKVRGLTISIVYAKDFSGTIKLMWFNCPFLRNFFHIGQEFVFSGEVSYKSGMMTMTQPEYYTPDKYSELTNVWQPVYTVTPGITSKTIQKAARNALPAASGLVDYLPEDVLSEYGIMDLPEAVASIHFPADEYHLKLAVKRIAFDEFYGFISDMHRLKSDFAGYRNECVISCDEEVRRFIEKLSFTLTNAQMNAVRDMLEDMSSDHVMNRLIQGDVGSGKTIVAAVGLFAAAVSGWQGVIMAPTEVLAVQHYKELHAQFEPYGISVGLLTGSMTVKEKRLMYQDIKNGDVSVIVGTHALIQDKVEYNRLGLVVTDEQHRFGVKQREKLTEKGGHPHTLVMSATPIPRTLAIIMYGDLDISVIDELPAGRIPIKNCVVDESYRKTAQSFIMKEVSKGHQVLAVQHYKELHAQFEPYGISVGLLTGSMTVKEKRLMYQDIKNGDVSVIVGTHALIQDKVEYNRLGLVVTDEQHRFGVKQREKLTEKGGHPHTLVMSATPIPRTLAIIMYGDLDISVIDELPAGRIPIKNCVVDESYRKTAQSFIMKEVSKGHQVYIVCPMVEASEVLDDVANVTEYTEELRETLRSQYGGDIQVTCLHGKMKADEKNAILDDFSNGSISILVSTTVIEVGINNPNATVMMVENAERFGLAQLHQLRGRVGRGKLQSYCIFVSGKKDKDTMERLEVLEKSNDGFYIAGEDLKMRGPGDFFGIRQSGEVMFKIGDIYNHADMLKAAQKIYEDHGAEIDRTIEEKGIYNRYFQPVL